MHTLAWILTAVQYSTMPIRYHIRYLKCYRPTKALLWKHHKLGLTLLPSFVISFSSPIWSVNSFSRLFDYLFAHQCQSSAVANVPSSSPGPRLCVWELPEAIQTANILHRTNMQSFTLHTKTFKLKYCGQTVLVQFCVMHWMNTIQYNQLTLRPYNHPTSITSTIKANHF